jgi:hypothetical protein
VIKDARRIPIDARKVTPSGFAPPDLREASSEPILDGQPFRAPKLARVVRDQGQPLLQRGRRDQRVVGADGVCPSGRVLPA